MSENEARKSNTISLLFSKLRLTNSTMRNNKAVSSTAGIFITFSTIVLDLVVFENTEYGSYSGIEQASEESHVIGGAMFISVESSVAVTNCTFENIYASQGGAVYLSGSSNLEISDSTIKNCHSGTDGGAIKAQNFDNVVIKDSEFIANKALSNGNDIHVSVGSIEISNVDFALVPSVSSIYLSRAQFNGSDMSFHYENTETSEYQNPFGSAIYGVNSIKFNIEGSNFTGLGHSVKGGAIALSMESSTKASGIPADPTHSIVGCNFDNNTAQVGGAIYIDGVDHLKIETCSFLSNQAIISDLESGGEAGAIYSSEDSLSKLDLVSNSFTNNTAGIVGGAIYWKYREPENTEAQSYSNNSATLYGNNIASFPQQLVQITEEEYLSDLSSRRSLSSYSSQVVIKGQRSGSSISATYLALIDKYGQTVSSDSESITTLNVNTTDVNPNYPPILEGTVTQIAKNGMFKFDDITFTAEPGSTYNLYFSSTGIDKTKPSVQEYMASVNKSSTNLAMNLSLNE